MTRKTITPSILPTNGIAHPHKQLEGDSENKFCFFPEWPHCTIVRECIRTERDDPSTEDGGNASGPLRMTGLAYVPPEDTTCHSLELGRPSLSVSSSNFETVSPYMRTSEAR